ncbi:putative lipoprotein YiaD [Andreprevotia sp. IGB-42]|uniref:DotU family type VI secretion system protein n=1 Tax=Andreprevotia sp. IGB-42 TaxID=2497473 RepID=UPI001357626B|nr:DotU family type VI secretion system protein [Andreprevotia sp. IGB-42]KAF0811568.1 putative lipoprotein YiaD [Andreprevotia sp. IGB-42]
MTAGTGTLFDPHDHLAGGGFVPPNPGGSGHASAPQPAAAPAQRIISGSSPLVAAANPLLNLVPQIRATVHHPDPARLREQLLEELRQFELRARESGVPTETIIGARYCLCTTLDEAATLTPWGGGGIWSAHSLLVTFHNETWGGEKFFQLLARLSHQPQQHVDLLELQYFCLMLGFEGRYRVLDQGRSQLDALKQRLLQLINTTRGEYPRALSPHWHDPAVAAPKVQRALPVWVAAAAAALLCLILFAVLQMSLAGRSDDVFAAIDQLRMPRVLTADIAPKPASKPRLAQLLEPEIRDHLVTVRDEADRSVVVLRGDGVFDSGAATVIERYQPLLARIGDALNTAEGAIVVTGYTDDVPTRGLRFASNWELSQARADTVKAQVQARLSSAGRVRAEGRGQADPVAPNDSAGNRARNRRVEITLLVPAGPAAGQSAAPATHPAGAEAKP